MFVADGQVVLAVNEKMASTGKLGKTRCDKSTAVMHGNDCVVGVVVAVTLLTTSPLLLLEFVVRPLRACLCRCHCPTLQVASSFPHPEDQRKHLQTWQMQYITVKRWPIQGYFTKAVTRQTYLLLRLGRASFGVLRELFRFDDDLDEITSDNWVGALSQQNAQFIIKKIIYKFSQITAVFFSVLKKINEV